MAERRMFAKTIVLSDAFLDMPMSARCLYFTFGMIADDDGFINSPKSIMRQCGASNDDMNILISKKFVLVFEDGIVVMKHWRILNYIQKDRYVPTKYEEHRRQLMLDENNSYQKKDECIHSVYETDTQVSIGKDSIELGKDSINKSTIKTTCHKYGEYNNVILSDEDMNKLKEEFPLDWDKRIDRLSSYIASTGKKYKNHLATIRNWARNDNSPNKTIKRNSDNIFLSIAKEEGIL